MAGTRLHSDTDVRDTAIIFAVLGFAVGMIVGAWLA